MRLPLHTDERNPTLFPSGLYVVATPIGNLKDITLRALETLEGVDLIAAEDTRHTARLLHHYHIDTPLISCHEHNEQQRTPGLIEKIQAGLSVALVSDAGTPSVSDPGFRLIRSAVDNGLDVYPVPGVSAAISALSASGFPMDTFLFLGFAPKKPGKRLDLFRSLASEPRTLIFYESPRRVQRLLKEMLQVMGDRHLVLAREMTKVHEEFLRGRISQVLSNLDARHQIKGECTVLVRGNAEKESVSEQALADIILTELNRPGVHISSLSKTLAAKFGVSRKKVYEMALRIDRNSPTGSGS
jgi:16S rRNA (cytidine1402-2'-O)-methyltransferase